MQQLYILPRKLEIRKFWSDLSNFNLKNIQIFQNFTQNYLNLSKSLFLHQIKAKIYSSKIKAHIYTSYFIQFPPRLKRTGAQRRTKRRMQEKRNARGRSLRRRHLDRDCVGGLDVAESRLPKREAPVDDGAKALGEFGSSGRKIVGCEDWRRCSRSRDSNRSVRFLTIRSVFVCCGIFYIAKLPV
jgi:hypothetical protein